VPALVVTAALARASGPWHAADLAILTACFWLLFVVVLAMPCAAQAIVSIARRRPASVSEAFALAATTLFALFWYERLKPLELWTFRYRPAAFDAGGLAAIALIAVATFLFIRSASSLRGSAARGVVAMLIGSAVLLIYVRAFEPSGARTEPARRLAQSSTANGSASPVSGRVLFIGVDGLDWSVVERLIAQHRLRHIEALVATGRSYELDAGRLSLSPEIWTTIYTGRVPRFSGFVTWDFHGVSRPIEALPASGHRPVWGINKWLWRTTVLGLWTPASVTTAQLTGPAFWRVASAAGLTVAVFEPVPFTVVGEEVNGVFGWEEDDGYRAHWKIAGRPPSTERLPFSGQYRSTAREALEVERRRSAIAGGLMSRAPIALGVYYTPVVDETSHWDWPDESSVAAAYEQVDRSIGALRERFGAPHTVVLASDHGWELNAYQHSRVPRGMLVVSGANQSGFGGTMRAGEVSSTVLALLGVPAQDDRAIAPMFLAPAGGRSDDAARERLKALGYIGR
jgi:nucleotide-binding universal stress UspA family protein